MTDPEMIKRSLSVFGPVKEGAPISRDDNQIAIELVALGPIEKTICVMHLLREAGMSLATAFLAIGALASVGRVECRVDHDVDFTAMDVEFRRLNVQMGRLP